MECPFCQSYESVTGQWCEAEREQEDCFDCEALGYWWVIPTAGHRAFPWWSANLEDIDDQYELTFNETKLEGPGPMPPSWPDHYKTDATVPEVDIKSLFKAQRKDEVKPHIPRLL